MAERRLVLDASSLERYGNTVLEIEVIPRIIVDLRRPGRIGVVTPFGVITAWNPRGTDLTEPENRERDGDLAAVLANAGWLHVRCAGSSPDRKHSEQGFAVWAPRDTLLGLAAEFQQDAIFWYDGADFSLCPLEGECLRLPLDRNT